MPAPSGSSNLTPTPLPPPPGAGNPPATFRSFPSPSAKAADYRDRARRPMHDRRYEQAWLRATPTFEPRECGQDASVNRGYPNPRRSARSRSHDRRRLTNARVLLLGARSLYLPLFGRSPATCGFTAADTDFIFPLAYTQLDQRSASATARKRRWLNALVSPFFAFHRMVEAQYSPAAGKSPQS